MTISVSVLDFPLFEYAEEITAGGKAPSVYFIKARGDSGCHDKQ
jgi:hypothetical protein